MDASPVQVEAERFGSAVADGEGGGGLGRLGEPVQLTQPKSAITGLDIAEHPAGTDRGQLLIITDKPDAAAKADDELDGGVHGQGVGHAGFVDDHQARPADAFRQSGRSVWWMDQVSLANVRPVHRWRRGAGRRSGRRRQSDYLAAAVAPRPSQGAHGGGFPGASGRDREL